MMYSMGHSLPSWLKWFMAARCYVSHWPQVSAQLRWYQGWSHLYWFASQKLVGLMFPQDGAGGDLAGGDGSAAHWPQVIAQLAWR